MLENVTEIFSQICFCALGLLANLKKTFEVFEVKGACRVEATSIMTVVKE
jgi:hypothetical protein